MNLESVFADLIPLPRWVPYILKWNPKREKYDKVPHNGGRGLSTKEPREWFDLTDAVGVVQEHTLAGVGLVFTGGITHAGWTLIGLDYDDVDFDTWTPPFEGYAERSPSKTGVHMYAWVPTSWTADYKDSICKPPACHHVEIYLGTSPRFLTVTFDVLREGDIPFLDAAQLKSLTRMGMKRADDPVDRLSLPNSAGTAIDFRRIDLTPDQRHLIEGTGKIDRSEVLHGLLIKLIDHGVVPEDVFATVARTPALWDYCLSHRNNDPTRALVFAREEIARAYSRSNAALRDRLIGLNPKWKAFEATTKIKSGTKPFPVDLFDELPGLCGDIARWIQRASFTPRIEFSYAAALSIVACLVGPYCTHGPRNSKVNLYLVLVGETGTGKNEAFDTAVLLLNATDAKDCVSDFPASEAALRRQLNANPNVLIRADELAHRLESMQDKGNGSLLSKAVLEMYNGARLPPKPYADEKKTLPAVENPFVQILGGTTDKVWDVLHSSHLEDGTLNRFVFTCLADAPAYSRNHEPDASIPKELKDRLNAFYRNGRMYDLLGVPGVGRKIDYDPEVKKAIKELDLEVWELQQQEYGSLYTRFVQNTMKIATILAVGAGRKSVSAADFEHAKRFMRWSVDNTKIKVIERMSDTPFESLSKRLVALVEKAGGRMRLRDAYRKIRVPRRELEEVIATLGLGGVLMVAKEGSGRRETEWLYVGDEIEEKESDE